MSSKVFSSTLKIDALLGAGFKSVFSSAENRVTALGDTMKRLNKTKSDITTTARAMDEVAEAERKVREETKKLAAETKNAAELQKRGFEPSAFGVAAALDKQRAATEKARAALAKKQERLVKLREDLKKAGVNTDRLSDEIERLGREGDKTGKKMAALGALSRVKLGDAARTMKQEWGSFFRTVTLGAAAAAGAIFGITKSVADLGDDLGDTSDALGVSTTTLQKWRYAALTVGIEAEKTDASIAKFSQNLDEAQDGTGKTAEALKELGLNARLLKAVDLDEAMAMVADAMASYQGNTSKATLTTQIFGKGTYRLAGILAKGTAELERLNKAGAETGYILGKDAIAAAGRFDEAWHNMRATLLGVRNIIGVELLPVLSDFFGEISDYVRGNGPAIRAWAKGFAAEVRANLPSIMKALKGIVWGLVTLGVALDTVANAIGGWDVLIGVFTTLLAGKALASTVMFTRELWGMGRALWTLGATYLPTVISGARALWVVLAANPIGILITLIGALALAIYTNWADIKQFFTDLWNDPLGMLKTYFEVAWSIFKWSPLGLIMQGWGKAMDWLGTKIDWVGSKWKAFKQFLGMETGLEYDPKEYRKELEAKGFNPPPLASAGGSNRTSTTNANITVNAAPGQDPKAIAAEVMRMLNQQQAAHAGGSLRDY